MVVVVVNDDRLLEEPVGLWWVRNGDRGRFTRPSGRRAELLPLVRRESPALRRPGRGITPG
jgi:hypothetical protein